MKIRGAGGNDIDALVAYGEKFWERTRYSQVDKLPYDAESVRELVTGLIHQPKLGYAIVVEDEGKVKGFGLVVQTPLIWSRKIMVAGELAWYVDPELRGSKAGIRLLQTMERIAKHRGIRYMAMISMEHSMDVGPLYERMGYIKTETTWSKDLQGEVTGG